MDITKSVQGVAVYGEFARSGATTQIIITPDGYDSSGNQVPMCITRRTVTTTSPRKQWRFSMIAENTTFSSVGGSTLDERKEAYCDDRLRYATTLFDQILRGEWMIVGDPILVEVSQTDLDAISAHKTPTKMLYRINQSRTAQGYPADLVNETPTTTSVPV